MSAHPPPPQREVDSWLDPARLPAVPPGVSATWNGETLEISVPSPSRVVGPLLSCVGGLGLSGIIAVFAPDALRLTVAGAASVFLVTLLHGLRHPPLHFVLSPSLITPTVPRAVQRWLDHVVLRAVRLPRATLLAHPPPAIVYAPPFLFLEGSPISTASPAARIRHEEDNPTVHGLSVGDSWVRHTDLPTVYWLAAYLNAPR